MLVYMQLHVLDSKDCACQFVVIDILPLTASMVEDQSGAADCYGRAVPMAMSSKVSQNLLLS